MPATKYKVNQYISAEKLLVIDEEGEQLGILTKSEALKVAEDKELDLIEVAPNAKPPVAKIYSWSKFKYQQDKKRKESKGKKADMKEMWFKAFIDKGDLDHKLKKVKDFLSKRHPVKLTIRAKGRVSRDHISNLMKEILAQLDGFAEFDESPKFSGRNMSLIVKPVKKLKQNEEQDKNTQSDSKKV